MMGRDNKRGRMKAKIVNKERKKKKGIEEGI